jgi:hypothetical protein
MGMMTTMMSIRVDEDHQDGTEGGDDTTAVQEYTLETARFDGSLGAVQQVMAALNIGATPGIIERLGGGSGALDKMGSRLPWGTAGASLNV